MLLFRCQSRELEVEHLAQIAECACSLLQELFELSIEKVADHAGCDAQRQRVPVVALEQAAERLWRSRYFLFHEQTLTRPGIQTSEASDADGGCAALEAFQHLRQIAAGHDEATHVLGGAKCLDQPLVALKAATEAPNRPPRFHHRFEVIEHHQAPARTQLREQEVTHSILRGARWHLLWSAESPQAILQRCLHGWRISQLEPEHVLEYVAYLLGEMRGQSGLALPANAEQHKSTAILLLDKAGELFQFRLPTIERAHRRHVVRAH